MRAKDRQADKFFLFILCAYALFVNKKRRGKRQHCGRCFPLQTAGTDI